MGLYLDAFASVDSGVMASELRKRLGAKFLLQRLQEKEWSRLQAAKRAGVDSGVIRRIELGHNYKFDAAEAYASVLGRPLEDWLWDVISEIRQSGVPPSDTATTVATSLSLAPTGGVLAVPVSGAHDETAPVPTAPRSASSRDRAAVGVVARTALQTSDVERPAGTTRAPRKHGATAGAVKADRRAGARKHRR